MLTRLNHFLKQHLRPFVHQEAHAEVEGLRADLEDQTGEIFHLLRDLSREEARLHLQGTPLVSAKTLPFAADELEVFSLPLGRATAVGDPFPIPPPELWPVAEHFLDGIHDVETMFDRLRSTGMDIEGLDQVLEVGCGPARLLRHLSDHAQHHEVWGGWTSMPRRSNGTSRTSPLRFASARSRPPRTCRSRTTPST